MKTVVLAAVLFVSTAATAATNLEVALPDQSVTGVPFSFTITARNGTATDTAYTGTVHVTSSDANSPSFPFDYMFVPADNGTHTFSATLATSGRGFDTANQSVTATDASNASITGTDTTSVKWNPSIVRGFTFDNPAAVTRTVPFNVTVFARNADGAVVTSFTGSVYLHGTDGITGLPQTYTFTPADQGVHTFSFTANLGASLAITVELVGEPATGFSTTAEAECPEFTATAGNNGPVCLRQSDPNASLWVTTSQQNATSYLWYGPYTWTSSLQNPTPPYPGHYSAVVWNSNRCTAVADTFVETKAAPDPVTSASSGSRLCGGGTVTFSVTHPSDYSNYVWKINDEDAPGTIVSGQGTSMIEVSTTSTIGVLAVGFDAIYTATGCPVVGGSSVILLPALAAHISTPAAACSGTQQFAATPDQGNGVQYTWTVTNASIDTGQGTSWIRYTPAGSGNVTLSVSVARLDGNNCAASDSTTVPVGGPRALVDTHATVCPGSDVTIPVTLQGTPPFSIHWSDGLTQSNINSTSASRSVIATESRTYAITSVTDANCSGSASGEAVITVQTSPSITQQPASSTIPPESSVRLEVGTSGDVQRYDWYEGTSGDRRHLVAAGPSDSYTTPPLTSSTSYWVEAISPCGDVQSGTAYITVNPRRRAMRH